MINMEMKVTGKKLTITVDLSSYHGVSSSGKSKIVATSQGNKDVPGTNMKIGLNIYETIK